MKREITFFATVLLIFGFCCTGQAANIVTYEDDVISFQYDTDELGGIDYYQFIDTDENLFISYSADTWMYLDQEIGDYGKTYVYLQNYETCIEELSRESDESFNVSVITDGDFPEIYVESLENPSVAYYEKLLSHDGDYSFIAQYQVPINAQEDTFCKTVYDSVQVQETFSPEDYIPDKNIFSDYIYVNADVSDQAINYAKEIVRILEGYLVFSIDADDAEKQLSDVYERLDYYERETNYRYDIKIDASSSTADSMFTSYNDSKIIDLVNEIKMIYKIE